MEGWIKFHRKSLNHWLYSESRPHTRREAWEDMLLMCNHDSAKVLVQGELIMCKRGQSIMSLSSWAKTFRWSVQQVRTFFILLENDNMINKEGLRKTTRITICNYGVYQKKQQAENKQINTQLTYRQQADNKQITTNNNDNNDYNDNKKEVLLPKIQEVIELYPLPFGKEFADTWEQLLKEQKWKKKSIPALNLTLKKLEKYDEDFAVMLMENAITGNYQGVVFPDTDKKYKNWKSKSDNGQVHLNQDYTQKTDV